MRSDREQSDGSGRNRPSPPVDGDDPSAATPGRRWTRPRARRLGAILLLALVGAALILPWGFARIGHWLVESDPAAPADAIFVHNGHVPFRAMEAARLYRQGLAPEVWLAPIASTPEQQALAELGIDRPQGWYWSHQVLERLGVPAAAIRLLDTRVLNTADEVRAVSIALRERGLKRALLVSSKQHTRRIRMLWARIAPDHVEAIIRPSRSDPYDPDSWWTNTESGQATVHELAGILNIWLGSPLRPERNR